MLENMYICTWLSRRSGNENVRKATTKTERNL